MASDDVVAQNIAAGEIGKPGARQLAGDQNRRRLRSRSWNQDVREAFLAGVKAERISALLEDGFAECSRCGAEFHDYAAASGSLELHHAVKRGRGPGYRPNRGLGVDHPDNLQLVCRPCHRELESDPQWSESA